MIDAEAFLSEHKQNLRRHSVLKTMLDQCCYDIGDVDGIIEAMSLRLVSVESLSTASPSNSKTERIALSYDDDLGEYASEIKLRLRSIRRALYETHKQIIRFNAVMAGLETDEQWLIQEVFIKQTTIEKLAEMNAPSGSYYSASTIARHRKKILEKINTLLAFCELDSFVHTM